MSKQKLPGTDLLNGVKNTVKQEKDGHMKKIDWKTVRTVVITLVAVLALVGAFLGGMKYQKSIDDTVKSEVKALSAVVSKE